MDAEEVEVERHWLLAEVENWCGIFDISNRQYLDFVFPLVSEKI